MYNFYQSKVWQDIQTKVYKNPIFHINLFGEKYFGVEKVKKVGPFKLKWLQILGVQLPEDINYVKEEINNLKKKYQKGCSNIFFQLGVINEIVRFNNYQELSEDFVHELCQARKGVASFLGTQYGLKEAFRENMPQANILYAVRKSDEKLLSEMSDSSAKRVKKAINKEIQFELASKGQYEQFFIKWQEIAGNKGFNTVSKKQFFDLMDYLEKNKAGALFISHIKQDIMSGSICLFDQDVITYLYGFSSRAKENVGGHQFLKFKMFQWARENGFNTINGFGGAPTGIEKHPLAGVSKFKESIGGYKIEHYGSFDLVLNSLTYGLFKKYFKWKK